MTCRLSNQWCWGGFRVILEVFSRVSYSEGPCVVARFSSVSSGTLKLYGTEPKSIGRLHDSRLVFCAAFPLNIASIGQVTCWNMACVSSA